MTTYRDDLFRESLVNLLKNL